MSDSLVKREFGAMPIGCEWSKGSTQRNSFMKNSSVVQEWFDRKVSS